MTAIRMWCVVHGVPYVVAYSIDDELAALDRWQCLNIRIAAKGGSA